MKTLIPIQIPKVKPEGLLLPPDFIHEEYFHKQVIHRYKYSRCQSSSTELEMLWSGVIALSFSPREHYAFRHADEYQKLNYIKDFCSGIKGLHSLITVDYIDVNITKHLLYLEELYDLPPNLVDESFIFNLMKKYNYLINPVVVEAFHQYILLDTWTKGGKENHG